jgi:putative flippase GtrA
MLAAIAYRLNTLEGRYVLAGAYNTAVGIVLYLVFFGILGDRFHYMALLTANYVLGTLNGFLAYKLFVFRSSSGYFAEYLRFNMVHLAGIAVNYAALPLLVEVAGLTPFIAQGLIIIALVIASFILHKRFTFKYHPRSRPPEAP